MRRRSHFTRRWRRCGRRREWSAPLVIRGSRVCGCAATSTCASPWRGLAGQPDPEHRGSGYRAIGLAVAPRCDTARSGGCRAAVSGCGTRESRWPRVTLRCIEHCAADYFTGITVDRRGGRGSRDWSPGQPAGHRPDGDWHYPVALLSPADGGAEWRTDLRTLAYPAPTRRLAHVTAAVPATAEGGLGGPGGRTGGSAARPWCGCSSSAAPFRSRREAAPAAVAEPQRTARVWHAEYSPRVACRSGLCGAHPAVAQPTAPRSRSRRAAFPVPRTSPSVRGTAMPGPNRALPTF